jgi:hypothetical protein
MFRWNHFRKQTQNRIASSEFAGGVQGIRLTAKMFDPQTKALLDVLGGTMGHERDYGSSSSEYLNMISKAMNKMVGEKQPNTLLAMPKKAWDGYQKLGEWSDAANRIAEFKGAYAAAKRNGMNDLTAQNFAAWKARDLMDFSVAGSVTRAVNRIMYMTFVNAQLQGMNRLITQVQNNPAKILPRLALYGLIPAMIPYLWAKSQGKDTEDRYKDTPLAQRIMFYQFHVGQHQIMFPKGQVQAMVSAMWEAYADKHNGNIGTWAKAMVDGGVIPTPIAHPMSILPFHGFQEAVSNYSWFYDKHIIPPDQEGLALDLRHVDGASRVSQFISQAAKKAGWEVDPRKIDHVLANDLGTAGIDAEQLSNLGSKEKPLANQSLASYADTRLPPGYTAVSVQDAMTNAQRYKDETSPQYKQVQEALSQSYKATTVEDRNKFVDQARAAADAANSFYDNHGNELLAAKEAAAKITSAVQSAKDVTGTDARRAWARDNPVQVDLLKTEPRLTALQSRITELRKALISPTISSGTKALADKEITRIYSAIVNMVGDTEKTSAPVTSQ